MRSVSQLINSISSFLQIFIKYSNATDISVLLVPTAFLPAVLFVSFHSNLTDYGSTKVLFGKVLSLQQYLHKLSGVFE